MEEIDVDPCPGEIMKKGNELLVSIQNDD